MHAYEFEENKIHLNIKYLKELCVSGLLCLKFVISTLNIAGRLFTTVKDQIKTLIENNLWYATRKLKEMLNMSKPTNYIL